MTPRGRSRSIGRRWFGLFAALLAAGTTTTTAAVSFPAVRGRGGAVASSDLAATETGLAILRHGGNAVDAAVATALALAVVFPEAGNLGGGGFAVVRSGDTVATLDFRETAPLGARREMYLDARGRSIPDASLIGPLASGVPGTPAGLFELHRRFGRLPWTQVVAPAVRLAAEGFQVSRRTHDSIRRQRALLARFPETARVWLPGGEPPPPGSRMRLPTLGATLRAYAEQGPPAITAGRLAQAVEQASARYGGILTAADLAAYRPLWRDPILFEAFDWHVAAMNLPSSGGILLGQILGLLERLDWQDQPRFGAHRAHLLAEVWRRAYADRFLLGDPATASAHSAQLLDPRWLTTRAQEIQNDRATPSEEISPRSIALAVESADTTHVSVVDGDGNGVALSTTLNRLFGCGLLVPEAGFLLNNEMDDFAAAPGRPNVYGLVQGEANAVGPGKRMLSSMSPTIAWRGDDTIVLGGRGGARIPTAVAQVLLHILVDGDPLQTAINRPRLHHQWLPDRLVAESDALSPETRMALQSRGHRIVIEDLAELLIEDRRSKVNAVRRHPSGLVEAAADPREPGTRGVVEPEL